MVPISVLCSVLGGYRWLLLCSPRLPRNATVLPSRSTTELSSLTCLSTGVPMLLLNAVYPTANGYRLETTSVAPANTLCLPRRSVLRLGLYGTPVEVNDRLVHENARRRPDETLRLNGMTLRVKEGAVQGVVVLGSLLVASLFELLPVVVGTCFALPFTARQQCREEICRTTTEN